MSQSLCVRTYPQGLVFWLFGCLVVWMFGCLDVWMFGCLVVWMFGCLVVWMFGCLVGWLVVWLFGCLVVWLFGCWLVTGGRNRRKDKTGNFECPTASDAFTPQLCRSRSCLHQYLTSCTAITVQGKWNIHASHLCPFPTHFLFSSKRRSKRIRQAEA